MWTEQSRALPQTEGSGADAAGGPGSPLRVHALPFSGPGIRLALMSCRRFRPGVLVPPGMRASSPVVRL